MSSFSSNKVSTDTVNDVHLDELSVSEIEDTVGGLDPSVVDIGLATITAVAAGYGAGYRSGTDRANRDNRGGGSGSGGGK